MGSLLMTYGGNIAKLLQSPESLLLSELSEKVGLFNESELIDLLELLEKQEYFSNRLPLRIKIYAILAEEEKIPYLAIISLIRLLKRIGSRTDLPDISPIPSDLTEFAEFFQSKSKTLLDDQNQLEFIRALIEGTLAYREGNLIALNELTGPSVDMLLCYEKWINPGSTMNLESLVICEAGHELFRLAIESRVRSGKTDSALELLEKWQEIIERWEILRGELRAYRYQYFLLAGIVNDEVGLMREAISSWNRALAYAPSDYRKAFVLMNIADTELELGLLDDGWKHACEAISTWLDSPYPQTARQSIEKLRQYADTISKQKTLSEFQSRLDQFSIDEKNIVANAMIKVQSVLRFLKEGEDPSNLSDDLDEVTNDLEKSGAWPNLITVLALRAVISGRLGEEEKLAEYIKRAKKIISTKTSEDAKPPMLFFLETAHALALRNAGAYEEAFDALVEGALEARKQYAGDIGVDEKTALEALYYLSAITGNEPEAIETRIKIGNEKFTLN